MTPLKKEMVHYMINSENGKTELKGSLPELMAELTDIIGAVKICHERLGIPDKFTKAQVNQSVRMAFEEEEEKCDDISALLNEIFKEG